MKYIDVENLSSFLYECKNIIGDVKNSIVCSPDPVEVMMLHIILESKEVECMSIDAWNLNQECPKKCDVVLASNVFLCSKDPLLWIKNVCKNTRWFVMLDSCIAYRGGDEGETSPSTGDHTRFRFPGILEAKFQNAFDLSCVNDRIVKIKPYTFLTDCKVEGYEKAVAFVALLKGDIR